MEKNKGYWSVEFAGMVEWARFHTKASAEEYRKANAQQADEWGGGLLVHYIEYL